MSKFTDKIAYGRMAECPGNPKKQRASCGTVTSTKMTWTEIQINDMTGELTMSFGPSFDYSEQQLKALRMKPVVAIGYLEPDSNKLTSRYMNTEENFIKSMNGDAGYSPTSPPAPISGVTPISTVTPTTLPPLTPATIPLGKTPADVASELASQTPDTSHTPIASSLPPSSAVAPLIESWVRLMGPKTGAEIVKFMNEKKKIPVQAINNTLKEMLDIGALVLDDTQKVRLA
jgi:hypothetical protein